jgi:hypothetical protein
MEKWKSIIAGLKYMIQFKDAPYEDVLLLNKAIRRGDAIACTKEEMIDALKNALHSEDDLSSILPKKHSDDVLRKTFKLLLKELLI